MRQYLPNQTIWLPSEFRAKLFRWWFCNRICFFITFRHQKNRKENPTMSPFEQASVNMNTYRPTIILIISYQNARIEETNACAHLLATNNIGICVCSRRVHTRAVRCMHNACVPNGLFQVYWITRQESIDSFFSLERNLAKKSFEDNFSR